MKVDLLCSGSKGNSCLVRSGNTSILIDAGSTKRYLMNALAECSCGVQDLDALLVSHTHSDHISQIKHFAHLPTYSYCDLDVENHHIVVPSSSFVVNDFHIRVIGLSHDAPHTVGYVIEDGKEKLVYITDTGYLPNRVKTELVNADHYIFESNHDLKMLMDTNRPIFLKQRILSDSGHLSNEDSAVHLATLVGDRTRNIVLAHLSQEANVPELATDVLKSTFMRKNLPLGPIRIQAARQFEIAHIYDQE